ncbi:MAG: sulfite exporter TauE/SafE family protein [Gammaproteobacteria bacterium]|nr:sulfite exporter TauE/SafE family protein [Gammaproteobacteria bacterium]MCK5262302.1 sulfite exporter TauE/SafE family protein [Gammaproteobacteria bacterium]
MIEELGLVLAGLFISTAAMTIGIGGGILWTPLLILAYGLSPQAAVATSLLVQVVGMGSGSFAFLRTNLVDKKLALIFFLAALPGVIIGSFITVNLPQQPVQMALGIMAMILALLFVASQDQTDEERSNYKFDQKKVNRLLPIPGFFGFIMGFLSLGIGEWLIPAMRSRLKLSMNRCVATIIPMMFLLAVVAAGLHWSLMEESVQTNYLLWGGLGTLAGGQIGPRVARYIDDKILKETFIFLMTLIGIHLIFQSI